ncbi:class I SAM-dependent methyltransferase [Alkalibacillus salilacus]|uniref:SAM-dependent methyltransferase n=1 Tax=Alkalibacillus salilacus TaxID=284582 RepID=A0ABT9VEK6_9BACI|nr:class I SAM-dependent methyltransferase [Alkalibacillus salilacus]MDQ0159378.1 SAM-dependent methyltransferase [Alkalibacillus salilacus]
MSKQMWDNSFSDDDFIYGREPNQFIRQHYSVLPEGGRIACFAEGEGRNAIFLAEQGYEVTTYDQSEIGLEKTKQLAEERGVSVRTVQKDLTVEKVDPYLYEGAIMVFGHVPKDDQAFLIKSMIDSVKLGGYIMFEVYSDDQLPYRSGGPKTEEMLYNPSDVLDWINDYKCLHFYYGEADRVEGKRHLGLGHVIQVIIQKI